MSDLPSVKKILILSANPKGTSQLRLDEEEREIKEGLLRSRQRVNFTIITAPAVRYRDIQRAILDNDPQIVHFSGHGAGEEGLAFEDETGQVKLVDAEALAGLFELFAEQVKCVVLNACYSEVQASAIAQHIPYVVGMNKAIGDPAAIEFAVGFYDALGADKDYVFAHKLGCSAVRMAGIKENLTPVLIQLKSSTPSINPQPNKPVSNERKLVAVRNEKVASQDDCINVDYYINRPPIEENCLREIEQQGALLRIKAPQKMGKSLLMNRIFTYAVNQKQYRTAYFDLLEPEEAIIADLDELLRCFCSTVSLDLGLSDRVEQFWSKKRAKTLKCRTYFEEQILNNLEIPLVLGLDNVDRLFQTKFNSIASDFFGMLRAWWGNGQRLEKWKKLRFVIVYATEKLPNLGINQSPFNVGKEIKLPDFTAQNIEELARKYGLNWQADYTQQLMAMVNGHPYLVHQAIEHLKNHPNITLEGILQEAPTNEGIYWKHLRHHWFILGADSELAQEFLKIILADQPISLTDLKQLSKLESMGLIRKQKDKVEPRCQLYRLYFRNHL